jgi:predicted acyl esterase
VYVARGWLRASHRALSPARSTALAPYQADQQRDARPLVPGRPTYTRIQLWPFDYVFRKGSSIRLWIDTPTGERAAGPLLHQDRGNLVPVPPGKMTIG